MDDTSLPNELEVYCTGIRRLNSSGIDIGPWHGTIAELKALGRYTQKYGCYYWETYEPDMQASVGLYLDMTSAESLGIEIRGPRPEFKVEGAGFGLPEGQTSGSPVDGQYWQEGRYNDAPLYTNGAFFLYCLSVTNNDWAIGQAPPISPYYMQDMGGPGGAYLVNLYDAENNPGGYKDSLIAGGSDDDDETTVGQRRFSGFAGYGIGPAVTADAGEAILVDSDCAAPSFAHNATCVFDAWPLSATSRTASPYMPDVANLSLAPAVGIYGQAHDHEDWVPEGDVTAPDGSGAFAVGPGGGSLKLTLKCNYRARQALVRGENEVPVPTAYLHRKHDSCLGLGAEPETHEGVWDWRGRYLLIPLKPPSSPQTITVTITYHDDLGGCSDNHKTDSTRQKEYNYSPGAIYTLTRTLTIKEVAPNGWGYVLVDLYNEQEPTHPVAMSLSIALTFTGSNVGAWVLKEPSLPETDTGDINERLPGSPGYREQPLGEGVQVKIDESWQYRQGVISATVNGFADRVLFTPDNAKPCIIEKCHDTLRVLYGAKTGVDLTSCYRLSEWPVTVTGERWIFTHQAAAEAAHLVDEDELRLTSLRCFDIAPQMRGGGDLRCAVRCATVECARGLPYTFQGTYYAGGQAQGWLLKSPTPDDYPRARSVGNLTLYRRPQADPEGEAGTWQDYAIAGTSNAHGRWQTPYGTVWGPDVDIRARLWEYGIQERTTDVVNLGRFATREWAAAVTTFSPLRGDPFLCRDFAGNPSWLIYATEELDCRLFHIDAGGSYNLVAAPVHPLQGNRYKWPSVAVSAEGAIIAAATDTVGEAMVCTMSRDGAASWEAPVATLTSNLQGGTLHYGRGGLLYASGWYDDKVWLAGTSRGDLQREVLDGIADLIPVCDYAVNEGSDPPRSTVVERDDGALIVAVEAETGATLYTCENLIEGFAEVT